MVKSWRSTNALLPLLVALFFLVLTLPVWRWLWGEWWSNEYYSHGILIPAISLFLAWRRLKNEPPTAWSLDQGDSKGMILLVSSLALYLYFMFDRAYFLAAFAMIALIAGLVWTFAGATVARQLAFPIGYLAFMVPLPFTEQATLPLAQWTGLCSGALVQFLGLDVTIVGSQVTLPNADLVIGAQCSGVNSLIALLALTTLLAYLLDGPWWGRIALVLLSIPLAMLGNILRVSSLMFVARQFGAEAAFNYYHDYSGLVFFFMVFLLMIPLTRLLQCKTVRPEVL
ncbi:MAG: exosortase/archaeosortase family protein [Chloroflexota bacterium]|nr:exosortase/archaeosortase family protein [Chloroflexota bacterium]